MVFTEHSSCSSALICGWRRDQRLFPNRLQNSFLLAWLKTRGWPPWRSRSLSPSLWRCHHNATVALLRPSSRATAAIDIFCLSSEQLVSLRPYWRGTRGGHVCSSWLLGRIGSSPRPPTAWTGQLTTWLITSVACRGCTRLPFSGTLNSRNALDIW